MLSRARLLFAIFALLLFATSVTAATPVKFGGQLDIADDTDFGLGVRALMDTSDIVEQTRFAPSFDFYFPDGPLDYWELNANAHYLFDLPDLPVGIYAGGGLNIAHASVDIPSVLGGGSVSNTDVGLNLIGGVDFRTQGSIKPFAELKIEVSGGEQFVATGGVTF